MKPINYGHIPGFSQTANEEGNLLWGDILSLLHTSVPKNGRVPQSASLCNLSAWSRHNGYSGQKGHWQRGQDFLSCRPINAWIMLQSQHVIQSNEMKCFLKGLFRTSQLSIKLCSLVKKIYTQVGPFKISFLILGKGCRHSYSRKEGAKGVGEKLHFCLNT